MTEEAEDAFRRGIEELRRAVVLYRQSGDRIDQLKADVIEVAFEIVASS